MNNNIMRNVTMLGVLANDIGLNEVELSPFSRVSRSKAKERLAEEKSKRRSNELIYGLYGEWDGLR